MRMPIRMDAQAIAMLLRGRGIDVPDAVDDAEATAHFGTPKEGDRYLSTGTPKKLMVYDGEKWIPQASM